jgi:uncharacterized phage protein (TIGR02218 family)
MTFIAQETGVDTGSPFELYEFTYGSNSWHYTSADEDYFDEEDEITYVSVISNRSNIVFSSSFGKNSVTINVQHDLEFLDLFRVTTPSGVVSAAIKKVHRYDNTNQIIVAWKGRVLNVDWSSVSEGYASLACESIRSSVQRYGLRRQFQTACPHVLYGDQCLVNKNTYRVIGSVLSVTGLTIAISGLSSADDDYFPGGYIEYTDAILNVTIRRMITAQENGTNNITVVAPTLNLTPGTNVSVYPGCDHTLTTCDTKFSNSINFGGLPYTPSVNPFGGGLVY